MLQILIEYYGGQAVPSTNPTKTHRKDTPIQLIHTLIPYC